MAQISKILLVEDSKFLRLSTERALQKAGYQVVCACDGEQALQMVGTVMPDLILLDLLLPKVQGFDVLKAVKKNPATAAIPVIVVTVLSNLNAARILHEGAFAFLEKANFSLDDDADGFIRALKALSDQIPPALEAETAQSSGQKV